MGKNNGSKSTLGNVIALQLHYPKALMVSRVIHSSYKSKNQFGRSISANSQKIYE